MINELRELIQTKLNSIKTELGLTEVAYRLASDQKAFPRVVWEIIGITPTDMGRADIQIDFDIWTKEETKVFEVMEAIVYMLSFLNDPQTDFYPTFFETSSGTIEDPDKTIIHGIVRTECQVYMAGITDDMIINKTEE